MQGIKELILLYKQRNVNPLRQQGTGKSKMLLLYNGISKGKFTTDDIAATELYGEDSSGARYRKLKADLREKLLSGVLYLLDNSQNDATDYQRAYYECHRDWVTVRYLTGQGANVAALGLANRLLRQAEKYHFTLLCMDVSAYLRIQYGLRESNDRKFNEINHKFEQYRRTYDWESKSEELYTTLIVRYVNNRSAQSEVARLGKEYYQLLQPAIEQYPTYKIMMNGLMVGLMGYTAERKYKQAQALCEDAIAFFKALPYQAVVPLQIFYYHKLVLSVHLREFAAGEEAVEQMALMQEGTFNWFKYREVYLHLSIHTRQYDRAADILEETLRHPKFDFLPDNAKELWRIFEAYSIYLSMNGLMRPLKNSDEKIAELTGSTPIFSRDKSGVNVAIIIIRLLVLFHQKQFSKIVDETEAIEQYCYRHLRGENTLRSYNFIKMLLQLPRLRFDNKLLTQKTQELLDSLNETAFQLANQTFEIEIIPFEHIWQLAVQNVLEQQGAKAA